MKKQIANAITGFRLFCSAVLLFLPVPSPGFSVTYLLGGLSDAVDGTVARRTGGASDFGARLDTCADAAFFSVLLLRLLPLWSVPAWLWIWIAAIAAVKIGCVAWRSIHRGKPINTHTRWNKVAGLLFFLLPLGCLLLSSVYAISVVCLAASLAAIDEGYRSIVGRSIT